MDTSENFKLMLDKAIKERPSDFINFDRTKNVQDQLQEMVGGFDSFKNFWFWFIYDIYDAEFTIPDEVKFATSMEQLWLAFVMKEKFRKIWNGEDWVQE